MMQSCNHPGGDSHYTTSHGVPAATLPARATASDAAATTRVLTLTPETFAPLPRATATVQDKDGSSHTYEGVRLSDVLAPQGVPLGKGLRGARLTDVLIVEATDGYRVAFALPEIDPAFTDRLVLLADKRDGAAITGNEGPLKLIVPDEKMRARWVRGVTGMRLISGTGTN